jgi:hypothetical protein
MVWSPILLSFLLPSTLTERAISDDDGGRLGRRPSISPRLLVLAVPGENGAYF